MRETHPLSQALWGLHKAIASMQIVMVSHRASHRAEDYMRVEVNDDGTFNIIDFTMPTLNGTLQSNVPQSDVQVWMMESISMLRITEDGTHVPGIGVKISDATYYINDRTGESRD